MAKRYENTKETSPRNGSTAEGSGEPVFHSLPEYEEKGADLTPQQLDCWHELRNLQPTYHKNQMAKRILIVSPLE